MKSIVETAGEDAQLSISVELLRAGGMDKTLLGPGEYTVLFPTNDAYSLFSEELLDSVRADPAKVANLVRFHVILGKLTTYELAGMEAIKTLQGEHLEISGAPPGIRLNGAAIIKPDIECTNGIYHIIDRVLLPRALEARLKQYGTG